MPGTRGNLPPPAQVCRCEKPVGELRRLPPPPAPQPLPSGRPGTAPAAGPPARSRAALPAGTWRLSRAARCRPSGSAEGAQVPAVQWRATGRPPQPVRKILQPHQPFSRARFERFLLDFSTVRSCWARRSGLPAPPSRGPCREELEGGKQPSSGRCRCCLSVLFK